MALSMTRPQKHPDSGYYWFRKRVPDDLRSLIGKREEHFSLGTRDPSEAKRLHALKLAEVEERWANLRVTVAPGGHWSCQSAGAVAFVPLGKELNRRIPLLVRYNSQSSVALKHVHRARNQRGELPARNHNCFR